MKIEIDRELAQALRERALPGESIGQTIARMVSRAASKVSSTATELYTYQDVSRIYQVTPRTVKRWVGEYAASNGKEGLGPVIRQGRTVRIPSPALMAFAARRIGY